MPDPATPGGGPEDVEKILRDLGVGGEPAKGAEKSAETKKPEVASSEPAAGSKQAITIDSLKEVPLNLKVELGKSRMYIQDLLKLSPGSIVELDKLTGDVLDLYVNDKLVAKGELLVRGDNFAIRITEIISPAV